MFYKNLFEYFMFAIYLDILLVTYKLFIKIIILSLFLQYTVSLYSIYKMIIVQCGYDYNFN
jgi:hypothetical protein